MRSEIFITSFILCSTSTIVRPAASARISTIVSSVSSGLMPAVGSSRRSSTGFAASAMASSRWRFSPCERCAASSSALRGEPDGREQLVRARSRTRERVRRGDQKSKARARSLRGDPHVLEHGQVREHVRDLVRLGDAEPRHVVLRHARSLPGPRNQMRPDVGVDFARDQAKERRLAGAVGADDRAQLALGARRSRPVDGEETPVGAREAARCGGAAGPGTTREPRRPFERVKTTRYDVGRCFRFLRSRTSSGHRGTAGAPRARALRGACRAVRRGVDVPARELRRPASRAALAPHRAQRLRRARRRSRRLRARASRACPWMLLHGAHVQHALDGDDVHRGARHRGAEAPRISADIVEHGKLIASITSEPEQSFRDKFVLNTVFRRTAGGGYHVAGVKQFCSIGDAADYYFITGIVEGTTTREGRRDLRADPARRSAA